MTRKCIHGLVGVKNSSRLGLLCVYIIQMKRCSQDTELLSEVCCKRKEIPWPHQGSQDTDFHRKSCWVYIGKKVLFAVPVKIQNEPYFSLLADILNERFDAHNFRTTLIFFSDIPFSIKILTCQISSIVSEHDPVWIHHRNHVKHKIFD